MADAIMVAARGMIGAPFHLHGRCAASGVDCVGLVVLALEQAGNRHARAAAPQGYRLRGGSVPLWEAGLRRAGLSPVAQGQRPGDVVLVEAGVAQFHLMIGTDAGHVHAHAGLGRVVETPGPSPWPVVGRWRCGG
ncbi:MAG: peptidoglycan endopeptidase [Sphingobium sp.]